MAYQSLYLRYRPQTFAQIKGQPHVVTALRTAAAEGRVGHAYLLHGPRGSGKTSTARVLAKALNCTAVAEGEPCCECESCASITAGSSFDLLELDAASNNGVDDMRALLERVNLTSPGRFKVYLLDEVHMLTPGAENALLKTLEEPPPHVVWVLATTELHKVVATIQSRCQVFELGLIDADTMTEHVREIAADAGLDASADLVDAAVSAGEGSVRDTLTALERFMAGGIVGDVDEAAEAVLAAIAADDQTAALTAVCEATAAGRDPRTVGEAVLAGLRDAFLTAAGTPPSRVSDRHRSRAERLAEQMDQDRLAAALEMLGRALIGMRQAPDPRIDIEVALMRVCQPDRPAIAALTARIDAIEARLTEIRLAETRAPAAPAAAPASTRPAPAVPQPDPVAMTPRTPTQVVELAQRLLGLDADFVVAQAKQLQPDPDLRRTPEQLQTLWRHLISHEAAASRDPNPR